MLHVLCKIHKNQSQMSHFFVLGKRLQACLCEVSHEDRYFNW